MGRPMLATKRKFQKSASKQVHWCCLPSPVLEKIYSLVNREDKFHMSLVCRWWSEEFRSSSASKTFRFALTESQLSRGNCIQKLTRFVKKHSIRFQHVEIECTFSDRGGLIDIWMQYLIKFLQILTRNSKLISVKFQGLWFYYYLFDGIYRVIIEFLGSQSHLKIAVFKNCNFRLQVGVEILRKLIENNRNSLSQVFLKGFTQNNLFENLPFENLPLLVNLPRLTTLEIDYSLIFENMFIALLQGNLLETLKNSQKLLLSNIILYIRDVFINKFRGLTSTDWQRLKLLCPDLEVELYFQKWSSYHQEEEFVIVPCMPITRLIFTEDFIVKLDVFFSHLLACEINKSLDYLRLYSRSSLLDWPSSLTPFLQACKKLRQFVLCVFYETQVSVLFIESLIHNRPESLKQVDIMIAKIKNKDDYMKIRNLIDTYASYLRIAGLKLRVFKRDWLRER